MPRKNWHYALALALSFLFMAVSGTNQAISWFGVGLFFLTMILWLVKLMRDAREVDQQIAATKASNIKENNERVGSHWFFWWILEPEEVAKEINGYNKLRFFQTSRGVSVLLIALSILITIILVGLWHGGDSTFAFIDILIFTVLALFIYKGKRWAMLLAMALWTYEKFFSLYSISQNQSLNGLSVLVIMAWWTTYMHAFYQAYVVETERRKKVEIMKPEPTKAKKSTLGALSKIQSSYCSECGSWLESDEKFCTKCGTKRKKFTSN